LAPKTVQRIRRLLTTLQALRGAPSGNGVEVALGTGYADQAHLIRECRGLLGETPRRFLARRLADSFNTRGGGA
jgi:AraC-like DNA-binding protein